MSAISRSIIIVGALALIHACYSAREQSAIQSHKAISAQSQPGGTSGLNSDNTIPIDIFVEAVAATVVVCLGLILASPTLLPIHWNVWASKLEREGPNGLLGLNGEPDKSFRGNPFAVLELRPGFTDIRKERGMFAQWIKTEYRDKIKLHMNNASQPEAAGEADQESTPKPANHYVPATLISGLKSRRCDLLHKQDVHPFLHLGQYFTIYLYVTTTQEHPDIMYSSTTSRESPVGSRDAVHRSNAATSISDPANVEVDETIMAVSYQEASVLGCAYYSTSTGKVSLLETHDIASIEAVERLLLHVRPTIVFAPGRGPDVFLRYLENVADTFLMGHSFILRYLSQSEFDYDAAKDKLGHYVRQLVIHVSTHQSDDMTGTVNFIDPLRLAAHINTNNRPSICCAGALLADLSRRQMPDSAVHDSDEQTYQINSIELFTDSHSMMISADTLASLQIFRAEKHANGQGVGLGGSSLDSKEGLCLYGLFSRFTSTPQGKAKLRQIFACPSADLKQIQARQAEIAILLTPAHRGLIESIRTCLKGVVNIRTALVQLQSGRDMSYGKGASAQGGIWSTLRRFSSQASQLRGVLVAASAGETTAIFENWISTLHHEELHEIECLIAQTIDFEKSRSSLRIVVASGIDSSLDRLNVEYNQIEPILADAAKSIATQISRGGCRQLPCCVFLPQMGFLTTISDSDLVTQGILENEDIAYSPWNRMFNVDGRIFYKNEMMKDMDSHYGDVFHVVIDREIEILHQLSVLILQKQDSLLAASESCGIINSIVALAIGARNFNWTAPVMTDEQVILIENGRHPLQELVSDIYIPNDCRLGHQTELDGVHKRILVLTGPNHSGKSIFLKQVALIVYLAHIGSFVPADSARIGVTDKILTRIPSRESVSTAESAFGTDLRQISFILKAATPQSLILIDEFGKGTTSDDGAGLQTALLNHFMALGRHCPRLLNTTHFHEIFDGGFIDKAESNVAFVHMDNKAGLSANGLNQEIMYQYKVVNGRCTASFGTQCAAMNGVDDIIIRRAGEIANIISENQDLVAACGQLPPDEQARLANAENVARQLLESSGHDLEQVLLLHGAREYLKQLLTPVHRTTRI